MIFDELLRHVGRAFKYTGYGTPPGWQPLGLLPLRATEVHVLFHDWTECERFPVSNAAFLINPRTVIAWKPVTRKPDAQHEKREALPQAT